MTTQLKATRFNIRKAEPVPAGRPARPAPPRQPSVPAEDLPFANTEDGFGDIAFPGSAKADENATVTAAPAPEAQLESIRKEGLTGRQLRVARRLAQRHNLPATSDFDAVRLLREAGIDPFQRTSMMDLVAAEAEATASPVPLPAGGRALAPLPGDGVKLPQTVKPIQVPTTEQRAEVNHAAEILKMQLEIAKRRKRKLALLAARMMVFVGLPTLIAAWYFSMVATPMYSTKSEFIIQTSEPPSASGMGSLLGGTPAANMQDSVLVQNYLMSRDALLRLEKDVGFRETFESPTLDPVQRLPADASMDAAYSVYGKRVVISYDQTEGLIKMEVISPDPAMSVEWSRKLISYAEEQVDHLSIRKREDTMADAEKNYVEAETAAIEAQQRVIELQEQYSSLGVEVDLSLVAAQIGALETQLTQERLNLAQMEANPKPNEARMGPVKARIATLEAEIASLRARVTEGSAGSESMARVKGELLIAEANVVTRQLLLTKAVEARESSRLEASRQVRYLALAVAPIPTDTPAYPRAFENTLVTMLILLGIYLMISMTVSILREQVSA